ncbi:MAG: S66 peptidase family protein [Candidatus Woesearchaeota archaeon]
MHKARIIAPSHRFRRKDYDRAISNMKRLGYSYSHSDKLFDRDLAYAGKAIDRAKDINDAYSDNNTDIIWAIRGGNGSIETLSHIDFAQIKDNPKPMIGYSDVSLLLNVINQKTGVRMIHGPNAAYKVDDKYRRSVEQSIMDCIDRNHYSMPLVNTNFLGNITGKIVGGNLSLVVDSLGTSFEIDTDDSILFFEDLDIKGRRLYTLLVQLYLAGKLNVNAIVFGHFKNCSHHKHYIRLFVSRYNINAAYTNSFGHGNINIAFPIGDNAIISSKDNSILFY